MFIFTNLVWRSLRSTDKDFCPAKCFILGPPLIACLAKLPKSLIEKCSSKKKKNFWRVAICVWLINLKITFVNIRAVMDYWQNYLHDSLIDKIEDPFLPITHPIFPGGTLSMDKISSSKVSLSTLRNSDKTNHIFSRNAPT